MTNTTLFDSGRQRFFRPLASSRRELIAACLRDLYERLHGPTADYAHNLNREELRELVLPVVRTHQNQVDPDHEQDEFNAAETADPFALTTIVIRALLQDGWLEQYPDRHGLVTAFRFSKHGKKFAEVFWALDRPSRSRQRNMRSCRNALKAALSDDGKSDDILDAYEHAEKVIEDLTDGIDDLQERIRHLMQEATAHSQWDDFVEFLERFKRDYSRQLTTDSATVNRHEIRLTLDALRGTLSAARFKRMEEGLHLDAQWAVKQHTGSSVFEWLLGRIEDIVNAAYQSKQPTFVRTMDTYVRRVTGLVQQSMTLRTGQHHHAYLQVISRLSERGKPEQDGLLRRIGAQIATAEVRLLDPTSFKLRSATQRRKASTFSVHPRASREARLEAALRRAEAEAFAYPNEAVAEQLRANLRLFDHPILLSSMSQETARELIGGMQAVEAARNTKGADLVVTKLPGRIENPYYSGFDYRFELKS